MAGDIRISKTRFWMSLGGVFCGVLECASKNIPDSMPALRSLVDERCNGFNYMDPETDCTPEEVRAFLNALQEVYKDVESAGPSSFRDPSFYPAFLEAYDELIRLIQEGLEDKNQGS